MAVFIDMTGPRIHRWAYFWPGLPQLWIGGSWAGLLVAVGFTALANVLLLATFVFHEWLPQQTRLIGYGALALVWLLSRLQSRAERRAMTEAPAEEAEQEETTEQEPAERDQLFRKAQGHYLQNDWVAAEQGLLKLLKQDTRDIESRLMLATLWRHQGRTAEATRQLDRLERFEAATNWQHEIAAERLAIEDEAATTDETDTVNLVSPETSEPPPTDEEKNIDRTDDYRRAA